MPFSGGGRSIRIGVLSSLSKLDPREAVDYVSALILEQIFDTPYVAVAGQSAAVPLLFEPLRREDAAGLQYSAAVRDGIRFSDGTPLTADIAARSLGASSVLAKKAAVSVLGDRVWFNLSARNARFELTLTQSGCAIVLEKGRQLLGTGAFRFDDLPNLRRLQSASSFRLSKNPHYHGSTALEEVEFLVMPAEADGTPQRLVDAIRAGEVDVTTSLGASDLARYQLTGVHPFSQPGSSTAILYFNSKRNLLNRTPLRRGIATALDLPRIASLSYARNPVAFIARGVLPPSMGRGIGVPETNRIEALRLIDESGARGARLSLAVPWAPRPYLPKPQQVAEEIRRQLDLVGITVSLTQTKSSDEFFQMIYGGHFDLALAGWIADTPDPADYYEALLGSHTIGTDNHGNYGRWQNAAADGALQRFRVDPSDAARHEIERMIRSDAPFVPLMYGQSSAVHTRKLRNVTISPTGTLALSKITVAG